MVGVLDSTTNSSINVSITNVIETSTPVTATQTVCVSQVSRVPRNSAESAFMSEYATVIDDYIGVLLEAEHKRNKKYRKRIYADVQMFCYRLVAMLIFSRYSGLATEYRWSDGVTWGMMSIADTREKLCDILKRNVDATDSGSSSNLDVYSQCDLLDRNDRGRIGVPERARSILNHILIDLKATQKWNTLKVNVDNILKFVGTKTFDTVVKDDALIEWMFFTCIDLETQCIDPGERSDGENVCARPVNGMSRRRIEDCLITRVNAPYATIIDEVLRYANHTDHPDHR